MIIIDFSSVMLANLHVQVGLQNIKVVQEDLLRHMILNTIRSIKVRFRGHDVVIACDKGSWRKMQYPYYKANRAKAKEKSDLDWKSIFECFTRMRADLKEFFPYRVIEVEGAEADDVIGTLVMHFGNDMPMAIGEEVIIVSPDKDFGQLHRFGNVKQFDPIKKRWIEIPNPDEFLREHVIKGDSGDGVPNIMSDDDTFVIEGKRQKTMTAKRLAAFKEEVPEEFKKGFDRNTLMIDLRNTPQSLRDEVMAEYESQGGKNRARLLNYFIDKGLRNLMESLSEF